jgi:hypothetical protein
MRAYLDYYPSIESGFKRLAEAFGAELAKAIIAGGAGGNLAFDTTHF